MPRTRYYSPRIERELVSQLYWAAKKERVPMTVLASRLIANGLNGHKANPAEAMTAQERPEPAAR